MTATERILHSLRFGRLTQRQIVERAGISKTHGKRLMTELTKQRVIRMRNAVPPEYEIWSQK